MATIPAVAIPNQLPDEEIVRRVAAGERDLFEILLRRHNQRIYRAVRGILRNESEVEDVMQQTYINAYRHLDQFEGHAAFATWLTKIALREAIAKNKKAVSTLHVISDAYGEDAMNDFAEPSATPEDRAVAADLMQHVEAEVAALPDAYRSVLLLREVEGLNTEETAACLDISVDLVKQRLHRARAMLRDALYRRAGVGLQTIFTFGSVRCDRVVARVMDQIRAL